MIFGRGFPGTSGGTAGPEVTHFKRPSKITITTTTEKSLTKLNGVIRKREKPRSQTRSVRQQATCGYIGPKALPALARKAAPGDRKRLPAPRQRFFFLHQFFTLISGCRFFNISSKPYCFFGCLFHSTPSVFDEFCRPFPASVSSCMVYGF